MHAGSGTLSDKVNYRERKDAVERRSDSILILHDTPPDLFPRFFFWLSAGRVCTEIDIKAGTVRVRWKAGPLAWHRVHALDGSETALIKEEVRLVEGYQVRYFPVLLVMKHKPVEIYYTDDPDEAEQVCNRINSFLPGRASGKS